MSEGDELFVDVWVEVFEVRDHFICELFVLDDQIQQLVFVVLLHVHSEHGVDLLVPQLLVLQVELLDDFAELVVFVSRGYTAQRPAGSFLSRLA